MREICLSVGIFVYKHIINIFCIKTIRKSWEKAWEDNLRSELNINFWDKKVYKSERQENQDLQGIDLRSNHLFSKKRFYFLHEGKINLSSYDFKKEEEKNIYLNLFLNKHPKSDVCWLKLLFMLRFYFLKEYLLTYLKSNIY